MGYKAVINDPSYLCHFNKNHDPKNGRFTFKKAWETIDTAVSKGYDAVEKVGRGIGKGTVTAVKSIKKSFETPKQETENSAPTGNNVATSTEEKPFESFKPPESFKTPELNEKNKIVAPIVDKLNKITKLPWLFNEGVTDGDYKSAAVQKWGKEYVDAADIGLKACKELNLRDAYGSEITNLDRSWFVLEDQTFGMAQVAYLASIGKTNKEINSIISANNDLEKANTNYTNQAKTYDEYLKIADTEPYKTNWYLYEASFQGGDAIDDDYINKCIEIANESKVQHSIVVNCGNYLVHYNKNHSKTNGQFTSGDGDGDGIVDDHHNQSKFLNKDGNLTKYARGVSGLNSIDMKSRKNVNYKKAQKLISKDVRKVEFWSGSRSLESEAAEYFAEKKLEKDIERADKDKDFMDALRKGVAKYFDIEKDDWSKAYDYEDQLKDELKKKYPQHKDVISGITIGENVHSGNYRKWLKTDNAFSDILNNDFYYEQSDLDSVSLKSIDDIISAYDRELANTMIQKYGSYNVDSAWKEKVGLK